MGCREEIHIRERKNRTKQANYLSGLRREGQIKSNLRQAINGHSINNYIITNSYKTSKNYPFLL